MHRLDACHLESPTKLQVSGTTAILLGIWAHNVGSYCGTCSKISNGARFAVKALQLNMKVPELFLRVRANVCVYTRMHVHIYIYTNARM